MLTLTNLSGQATCLIGSCEAVSDGLQDGLQAGIPEVP
jgi:hypothetical protein